MRWGFTPDPFIYTRWAIEAAPGTEKREHDWVTGVRGEEYLEMISDWNRTKPIWRQKKWGIDNFVHEIFKCMEEMALSNAYLLQREDGSYVGYNCTVESTGDSLTVMPLEDSISRLHLNLRQPTLLKASIGGENIEGSYDGMQWIGPGGIPQDIRPFMDMQASRKQEVE
jgi:hypothetical protein